MPDHVILNQVHLQYYLTQYKASLSRLRNGPDHEIYKWKAVKRFQDNWDINASDFPAMLKASLSLTGNLLASVNNFPRSMMEQFADLVPEDVRSMFQTLFDESLDLSRRVMAFEKESERIRQLKPDWNQHYQTPNAISTYLWLRYPEKYYIYKYNIIKDNARKLCGMDMPSGKVDRMLFGFSLYGAIAEALSRDQELVSMSRDSLDADCDPDLANHTMTIDFGYFVSRTELPEQMPPEPGNLPSKGAARSTQTKSLHGIDHNTILYGPPGTGKTYGSALYAVAIMENKPVSAIRSEDYSAVLERYRTYMQQGLIAFTTFHQAYGFEEFIEGIRPVVTQEEKATDGSDISYEIRDGVFKAFCGKAGLPVTTGTDVDLGIGKNPTVWKVSLEATGDNPTRTECMENGHIRIGWDEYGGTISEDTDYRLYGGRNVLKAFYDGMQLGDLVLSCYSGWTIDAIGVITGDPEWRDEYRFISV
jgi:5-methylcytosine-specific restriction protein B